MGGRGSGSGRGGSGTPRGVVAFDIDMDGARAGYVVKNGKVYSEMVILSIYQHHKSCETRKIWDMA